MMLNAEDRRPILIKNLYCLKGYDARKLMQEFPDKIWKKNALNFLNRLKETGNCAQEVTLRNGHPTE